MNHTYDLYDCPTVKGKEITIDAVVPAVMESSP